MKMLVRMITAVLAVVLVAGAASWVISMPKTAMRGVWKTEGHGLFLDVGALTIDVYEHSAASCQHTMRIPAHLGLIRLAEGVRLSTAEDRLSMSADGTIGAITADRVETLPGACVPESPGRPGTAQQNFDVFWAKMDAHYAFFDLHAVDWAARRAAFRPADDAIMGDDALFALLSKTLVGLDDGHVSLSRDEGVFSPYTPPEWYDQRNNLRNTTQASIPGGLTEIADTGLSYGWAAPGIGYISITEMDVSPGFGTSREAFAASAFAPIMAEMTPARAIIVDVRHNPGGSDLIGLAFASYFTATPVPVLSKTTRTETGYSAPLTYVLQPTGGPALAQPVILLTGPLMGSAAEIFTMAMRELPQVTVLGTPTSGGLSDILEVTLPSGWTLGLSHQRYLDPAGTLYEKTGIPPDIARPFDLAGFAAGHDSLLAEAVAMTPAP
jgi:carboxyl-terminal processing protease